MVSGYDAAVAGYSLIPFFFLVLQFMIFSINCHLLLKIFMSISNSIIWSNKESEEHETYLFQRC